MHNTIHNEHVRTNTYAPYTHKMCMTNFIRHTSNNKIRHWTLQIVYGKYFGIYLASKSQTHKLTFCQLKNWNSKCIYFGGNANCFSVGLFVVFDIFRKSVHDSIKKWAMSEVKKTKRPNNYAVQNSLSTFTVNLLWTFTFWIAYVLCIYLYLCYDKFLNNSDKCT